MKATTLDELVGDVRFVMRLIEGDATYWSNAAARLHAEGKLQLANWADGKAVAFADALVILRRHTGLLPAKDLCPLVEDGVDLDTLPEPDLDCGV